MISSHSSQNKKHILIILQLLNDYVKIIVNHAEECVYM